MKRLGTTTRIAFALTMWSVVVLLVLRLGGILSDGTERSMGHRTQLCETLAVTCSQFASRDDFDAVRLTLESLVMRDPEIISAACRPRVNSLEMIATADHQTTWRTHSRNDGSTINQIAVTVFDGGEVWGQVEVAFQPIIGSSTISFLQLPSIQVIGCALLGNLLGFAFVLSRSLRHLDPSRAVPDRVRSALNTMSELVIVLDGKQHIMLANDAFARLFHQPADEFQGQSVASLPWEIPNSTTAEAFVRELLSPRCPDADVATVRLNVDGSLRTFQRNASQITDEKGNARGTLLSLDDITVLAARTEELHAANRKLQFLATRDPLTSCLNRRSFFEEFNSLWDAQVPGQRRLACIMVDIDHFKSINDQHGHAVGDDVLRGVSACLLETVGEDDLVCRYGGEEFCILLIDQGLADAGRMAEKIRAAIEKLEFPQLSTSASLGCSATELGAVTIEAFLEQADQALYEAKRSGRNRYVCFVKNDEPPARDVSAGRDKQVTDHELALLSAVSEMCKELAERRAEEKADEPKDGGPTAAEAATEAILNETL